MSPPEMPQNPEQPAAPAYQAAPAPAAAPVAAEPGKGLSIAAIILAFLVPLVGLILGIVALVQAKKAGRKNGLALAAVIIGAVLMVVYIIIGIVSAMIVAAGAAVVAAGGSTEIMEAAQACMDGATSVEVLGQTLSCEEILAQQ